MLKPTSVSALDTSRHLFYQCQECKKEGILEAPFFNVNHEGAPEDPEVLKYHKCENCNNDLSAEDKV